MNKFFALAGLAALALAPAAGAVVYSSTGNNIAIPDSNAAGATLDIVITDSMVIGDMNLGVIITHSWQGDLSATIEHVGFGGPVTIINRPGVPLSTFGYSADNYGNNATGAYFILDDEAASVYDRPPLGGGPNNTLGTANVTGSWKPDGGALSTFDGQNTAGTWRLKVVDNGATDTGFINALQLDFQGVPAPSAIALLGLAGLVGNRRRRA